MTLQWKGSNPLNKSDLEQIHSASMRILQEQELSEWVTRRKQRVSNT